MTRFLKFPISENLSKAEIQDTSQYNNFTVRLNTALKQDRFSLFSRSTFDRKTKSEIWRKRATPFLRLVFWISAISIIALVFAAFVLKQINKLSILWNIVAIILGCLFIGSWFGYNRLKHRPESHASGGLKEETTDLEKARIVQDWAQKIIDSKKRIFIQDNVSGDIHELSNVLATARNNIICLIGDIYHRRALGVAGYIPEGPLLYLKDDEEKIFQPLKDAISKISSDNQPAEIENSIQKDAEISNQADTQPKSGTTQSTRKKDPPRDYRYHKTIMFDKGMCTLVVEKMSEQDFFDKFIKGNGQRIKWYKTLSIISENPEEWVALQKTPKRLRHSDFAKKLFGVEGLNTSNEEQQHQFMIGGNHYLNALIKSTDVIPDDKLSS